jgi:hypothetical protein
MLSEEQESVIEEHLAECSQCTDEARHLYTFTNLWNRWTARNHGQAYQHAMLLRALQQMYDSGRHPRWRERLVQWRDNLADKAGAAIRVAIEAGENVTRTVTEGLEALVAPSLQPAPVRVRGAVRTRGGTTRTTLTPEQPQARVEVQGERGVVVVQVENLPPGSPSPLVLLISTSAAGEPEVQELHRQEDGVYMARFESVESGDYLVAFEPAR